MPLLRRLKAIITFQWCRRNRAQHEESVRKTNSIRSEFSTTISVLVGEAEEAFTVHEDLINARSSFFKAATKDEWEEGKSRTVLLPEQEPIVFKAYLESVYAYNADLLALATAHYDDLVRDDEDKFRSKDKAILKTTHALVKFYVLGDFLGDILFKNDAIRGLIKASEEERFDMGVEGIKLIFDHTPSGSAIRELVADLYAYALEETKCKDVDKVIKHLPQEAVPATLRAMAIKRYREDDYDAEEYLESSPACG